MHGHHDLKRATSHANNAVDRRLASEALGHFDDQGETVMADHLHVARKEEPVPAHERQRGGIGYVLLWLLGVPLPVLILIALVRGCA